MKTQLNHIMLVLLIGAAIVCQAAETLRQTGADKQWKVRYISGTETVKKGAKIITIVRSDSITWQSDKQQSFSIPVSAIKEVSYDNVEKKRTKTGVALMAASPLAGLIVMGTRSARHYVTIVSEENGEEKETTFEVGKNDRDAFLAELQRVTGRPWHDRVAERKKTESELDHKKKENISVQLDRKALIKGTELKPGLYQMVLLERESGSGELYFFAGKKVKPKKSVAMTTVEIVPESNVGSTTQVRYQETSGAAVITEIQTPSKTFRLRNN